MVYNWKGKNLKEWCQENGMIYANIFYELTKSNLTFNKFMERLEKKLTFRARVRKDHQCKYKFNGKNVRKICLEQDLSYNTVMKRIYMYKGDVQKAIETVKKNKQEKEIKKQESIKKNPCLCCNKRNCVGCPRYLFEEEDKKWRKEKYETTKKLD